jgi:predicted site-specific integrase-resolvase
VRESEPLFVISVASRLLQLHPQTLRKYEREGFVAPSRTQGNLRLYSRDDIDRLRQVKMLVEDRVNGRVRCPASDSQGAGNPGRTARRASGDFG